VPFLLTATFADSLAARLKHMRRLGRVLQILAGIVMILMGLAMITGQMSAFAFWLLERFPVFARIG
jgi:cytochrome c-type biogenesis protein